MKHFVTFLFLLLTAIPMRADTTDYTIIFNLDPNTVHLRTLALPNGETAAFIDCYQADYLVRHESGKVATAFSGEPTDTLFPMIPEITSPNLYYVPLPLGMVVDPEWEYDGNMPEYKEILLAENINLVPYALVEAVVFGIPLSYAPYYSRYYATYRNKIKQNQNFLINKSFPESNYDYIAPRNIAGTTDGRYSSVFINQYRPYRYDAVNKRLYMIKQIRLTVPITKRTSAMPVPTAKRKKEDAENLLAFRKFTTNNAKDFTSMYGTWEDYTNYITDITTTEKDLSTGNISVSQTENRLSIQCQLPAKTEKGILTITTSEGILLRKYRLDTTHSYISETLPSTGVHIITLTADGTPCCSKKIMITR